jgi:hypothetical protein
VFINTILMRCVQAVKEEDPAKEGIRLHVETMINPADVNGSGNVITLGRRMIEAKKCDITYATSKDDKTTLTPTLA